MEANQGQPAVEPASQSGSPNGVEPAGLPPELSHLTVEPASAPAPAQQDGQPNGQPPAEDQSYKHFQSLYNQTLAQNLALQEQLRQQNEFLAQRMQNPQMQGDPKPDQNVDPVGYLEWTFRQNVKALEERIPQVFEQRLQGLVVQAQEQKFAAEHPEVDIPTLKRFAQVNGIDPSRLDTAYSLFAMPQKAQEIARAVQNQTINQFQQPTNGASAARTPAAPASPQTQLSFAKMAAEWESTHGNPKWPDDLKQAFLNEAARRQNG